MWSNRQIVEGQVGLMIPDCDTNVVFVAESLERRFPGVYRGLASILGEHAIPLRTILGTRQIWVRDFLPIQVAEDGFIQFRYAPDYSLASPELPTIAEGDRGGTPW